MKYSVVGVVFFFYPLNININSIGDPPSPDTALISSCGTCLCHTGFSDKAQNQAAITLLITQVQNLDLALDLPASVLRLRIKLLQAHKQKQTDAGKLKRKEKRPCAKCTDTIEVQGSRGMCHPNSECRGVISQGEWLLERKRLPCGQQGGSGPQGKALNFCQAQITMPFFTS